MSDQSAATVDIFSGICLMVAVLGELREHGERLQRLEALDRQRRAYHEQRLNPLGMPQRPRGRPRGSRNKPKMNGADHAAVPA
jgi:hypothetical protein